MSTKADKFIKILEETKQADISEGTKRKHLVEVGVDDKNIIEFLISMRDGPLTTADFEIGGDDQGDSVVIKFRILTAQEEIDIEEELIKLKIPDSPFGNLYRKYYISKVLAKATTPIPSNLNLLGNQPVISEQIFRRTITTSHLLAIGYEYLNFLARHSKKLETLTQERIDAILDELVRCEQEDIKKLELLDRLSSSQTQEVLISLLTKYETLIKRMEVLCTGT